MLGGRLLPGHPELGFENGLPLARLLARTCRLLLRYQPLLLKLLCSVALRRGQRLLSLARATLRRGRRRLAHRRGLARLALLRLGPPELVGELTAAAAAARRRRRRRRRACLVARAPRLLLHLLELGRQPHALGLASLELRLRLRHRRQLLLLLLPQLLLLQLLLLLPLLLLPPVQRAVALRRAAPLRRTRFGLREARREAAPLRRSVARLSLEQQLERRLALPRRVQRRLRLLLGFLVLARRALERLELGARDVQPRLQPRLRHLRRLEVLRRLQALQLGPQPARRLLAVGRAPLRRRGARALVGQRALLLAHRLRCGRRLSLRLAQ